MMQILVGGAKNRLKMLAAFQQSGHQERDSPGHDDEHPNNEKATKSDLGKEVPI
jgi:hypothetical protein